MPNKHEKNGVGFTDNLYESGARVYRDFVKNCRLEPILDVVRTLLPKERRNLLELGPGTGAFTLPLAALFENVLAVEKNLGQVHILLEEISAKSINNIEVIHADATNILRTQGSKYDCVIFAFSVDNISDISIHRKSNLDLFKKLIVQYMDILEPHGRMIIIGSMPDKAISENVKLLYEGTRSRQFAYLKEKFNASIEFIRYKIGSSEEGQIFSYILGQSYDKNLERDGDDFTASAYVACLEFSMSPI